MFYQLYVFVKTYIHIRILFLHNYESPKLHIKFFYFHFLQGAKKYYPFEFRFRLNQFNEIYIITNKEHTCQSNTNSTTVYSVYLKQFTANKCDEDANVKARTIQQMIVDDLGIVDTSIVSATQIKNYIYYSKHTDEGQMKTADLLIDFVNKFNSHNEGRIDLKYDRDNYLSSIYIQFNQSKFIKTSAIKVFFLDGTHQRTSMKGTLLILSAITGFKKVLPVSILWCLSESQDTTATLLNNAMNLIPDDATVKSDAAACFISELASRSINHSLCVHHLMAKMKSMAVPIITDMKQAYSIDQYNTLKEELSKTSPSSYKKIKGKEHMYFRLDGEPPTMTYEASSPIESMNRAIMDARESDFVSMLTSLIKWNDEQVKQIRELVQKSQQDKHRITPQATFEVANRKTRCMKLYKLGYMKKSNIISVVPKSSSVRFKDSECVIYMPGSGVKKHPYESIPENDYQRAFIDSEIPDKIWCSCQETSHSGLPCVHMSGFLPQSDLVSTISPFWAVDSYDWILRVEPHYIPELHSLSYNQIAIRPAKSRPGRPKDRLVSVFEMEKIKACKRKILPTINKLKEDVAEINAQVDELDKAANDCEENSIATHIDTMLHLLDGIQKEHCRLNVYR